MKNISGIACSAIGSSHVKTGKGCQDASLYINEKNYAAIMVSDGHGGNKHFRSAIGSQIAIEICKRELPEFIKGVSGKTDMKQLARLLSDFEKHIIYSWRDEIENELIIHPLLDDELLTFSDLVKSEIEQNPHIAFGATLLLAIAACNNLFIIQLGDGDCRIQVDKRIENPIESDDSLHFGRTASLCNDDAVQHIRDQIIPLGAVEACFLSSDGVFNSFDTEEHFRDFLMTVSEEMTKAENDLDAEMKEFLPKLSCAGSGDDVSIAVFVRNTNVDIPESKLKSLFKL